MESVLAIAAELETHSHRPSKRVIANTFNQLFASEMSVSKSFVAYTLKQNALKLARLKRFKHQIPKPTPIHQTWAIDFSAKQKIDGYSIPFIAILDHGSRFLLRLKTTPRLCTFTVLGHLCLAIAQFGKPKSIRTDNASCFTSKRFAWFLNLLNIKHQRTTPGCPWQNGRVERFFLTLKQKLNQFAIAHQSDLAHCFKEFTFFYNNVRPHHHLFGLTPAQVLHGIDPFKNPPKSIHLFHAWQGKLSGFYFNHQKSRWR